MRPPSSGRSLVPLAFALTAAAAVASARRVFPSVTPSASHFTLADGVRRLRAAVVGDAREPAGAPVLGESPVRARLRARTSRLARRTTPLDDARSAPHNDVVGVPWWDENAGWGADVVRWAERTTAPLTSEAGDTVAVAAPALPEALPTALRARGVHWSAQGAVTLLGDGRAVLEAPGSAAITAVTPVGVTRTPLIVRPVVRGRLYAATDGGPVSARIVVRRGAWADTTWTDASGRFRLGLPPDASALDAADVHVEPSAPAARGAVAYEPCVLHAVPAARLHTLGVVVLPARWTVTSGSYAGVTVPVRATAARGYWQFTREHGAPIGWIHDAPHTVAFAPGFDPVDQATFWRAARAVEDAWGRSLFVPFTPAASGDSADADVVVRPVPTLHADGLTTIGWDGVGTVGGAAIDFRIPRPGTLQPQVAAHELLHALGFGHARNWLSVLAPAGRAIAPEPTAADVAYGQLYEGLRRQARRAEHDYGGAYGWDDAAP